MEQIILANQSFTVYCYFGIVGVLITKLYILRESMVKKLSLKIYDDSTCKKNTEKAKTGGGIYFHP